MTLRIDELDKVLMNGQKLECLLSQGSISFPSGHVIRYLEELIEYYGKSKYIRTDNGPEFISNQYKTWCLKQNITPMLRAGKTNTKRLRREI